jgi:hypothetical protein
MQLSQLTLEPHNSCYACWVQVVYSHLPPLLFCSLGISSTAVQYQATWRTTSADLTISRRCLPVDIPVAPHSSCIILRFRIPRTDSWFSCNKDVHLRCIRFYFEIRVVISWWFCYIYICMTWSWRIYDCLVYVFVNVTPIFVGFWPTKLHYFSVVNEKKR